MSWTINPDDVITKRGVYRRSKTHQDTHSHVVRLRPERDEPPEEVLKNAFDLFLGLVRTQLFSLLVAVERRRRLGDEVLAQLGLDDGHSRLEVFPEEGGVDGEREEVEQRLIGISLKHKGNISGQRRPC